MSITDELRRWARTWRNVYLSEDDGTITYSTNASGVHLGNGSTMEELILAIADRIDEECRKRVEEAYEMGCFEYGEPQGFVKLPVDADGVPIHAGDVMTNGINQPAKVLGMVMGKDGWVVGSRVLGVDEMVDPTTLHHVYRDSWERIIEDAANLVRGDNESVVGLVERCRRLAGEA